MTRDRALDIALAAAVGVAELANLLLVSDGAAHRDAPTIALLLASSLPLVAWRVQPFAVSFTCAVATVGLAGLGDPHLGLGVIVAVLGVACWSGQAVRRGVLVTLVVGVPLVPLLTDDTSSIPKDVALYGAAWILGTLLRERRVATRALELRAAELERSRIARELHDVLAHSMSVIVIQAQGAQAAIGDRVAVERALARIEDVGRESMRELRGLLARVRAADEPVEHAPAPGLAQLDALLGEVRAAGLAVSLDRAGEERVLPPTVDLSAYRIVQEALTNTLRHARGAAARVVLSYEPDMLAVEITDDGEPQAAGSGNGRGLAGMRERAALAGGDLVAGPLPGGGFRIAARLPL